MQVITDPVHVNPHNSKISGSYEWWYFDFIDDKNEYSAVIVFMAGNPFSPGYSLPVYKAMQTSSKIDIDPLEFSAISVNVYHKQRVVYHTTFEFGKSDFSYEEKEGLVKIRIGNSTVTYNKNSGLYEIDVNYSYEKYGTKIRFELTYTPLALTNNLKIHENDNSQDQHYWMPSSPMCKVSFKMVTYQNERRKKTELAGYGYAHHVWGFEPFFKGIKELYWGRVILGNVCLIYNKALHHNHEESNCAVIMLFRDGELIYTSSKFPFQVKSSRNYWLLNYGGQLKGSDENLKFTCRNEDALESKPYFVRSLGEFTAEFNGSVIIDKAVGITEYINPGRLGSSLLWYFAKNGIKRIS